MSDPVRGKLNRVRFLGKSDSIVLTVKMGGRGKERKALEARKERGLLASFCVKKITGLKRFKRLEKVQ